MIVAACKSHRVRLVIPEADALVAFYVEHERCHVDVTWDESDEAEVERAGKAAYAALSGRDEPIS